MSICDYTTVDQETTLKLQSIRKTKTCRNACKKTFNDPKIRRSAAVLYKKSTAVPVLKKYRGIFIHGTADRCIIDENTRFACLTNVMSFSQAEACGLALSKASRNIEPYAVLFQKI